MFVFDFAFFLLVVSSYSLCVPVWAGGGNGYATPPLSSVCSCEHYHHPPIKYCPRIMQLIFFSSADWLLLVFVLNSLAFPVHPHTATTILLQLHITYRQIDIYNK